MTSLRPTTEVIVCTYHGAAFVVEQLRSIVQQTVQVDKISVYDDRSSDDTVACMHAFLRTLPPEQRRLFTIYINPRNLGYAGNFSSAIENAVHDIVFLSDQDDVWEPQKVERLLELFRLHGADMVFSDGSLIDEAGRPYNRATVLETYGLSKRYREHFRDQAFRLLLKRNYINGAAAAIRRVTAQGALPLPCDMPHDYWLALWCALHGGVVATPETLYRYRQHRRNVIGVGSGRLIYAWLGIWRQPDTPRERELSIWTAVTERISALPRPSEVQAARRKLRWLSQVVPQEKKSFARARAIAKSALNGSYRAYSGSDALLRDIVSLIR